MPLKDYEEHKRRMKERYWNDPVKYRAEAKNWRSRNLHRALKERVLAHYSGVSIPKCRWCPDRQLETLTIDHIADNGAEERRRLGRKGLVIYWWLEKQGYPAGYQTL